jgi:Rha family phage regulatory protein
MENLVIMKDQQAVTTSLNLADSFEKQHKHVLEAIEAKIQSAEFSAHYEKMFALGTYKDSRGRHQKMYYMNRDGWTFIAVGFTGRKADNFKLKYIEAFNQMEDHIKQQSQIPKTARGLALLALETGEETNQRIDEIDERLVDIEENKLITTEDKGTIDRAVRKKVYQICKEQHFGQEVKSMLYQDLGSSIKQLFDVPNRGRIKDMDFRRVLSFINSWEPSSVTKERINQIQTELDVKEE